MAGIERPAVALAAVPKRRRATIEMAQEIERRGFAGIYCASVGDGLGLCLAMALETERIPIGTAISNLYTRAVSDFAQTTAMIHELSEGRFRFGVGVSHTPLLRSMGLSSGKPLQLHAHGCQHQKSRHQKVPRTAARIEHLQIF